MHRIEGVLTHAIRGRVPAPTPHPLLPNTAKHESGPFHKQWHTLDTVLHSWIRLFLSHRCIKVRRYLGLSIMFDLASHQMNSARLWATGDRRLRNTDVTRRHIESTKVAIKWLQRWSTGIFKEINSFTSTLQQASVKYFQIDEIMTEKLLKSTKQKMRGKMQITCNVDFKRISRSEHAFIYARISKWRIFRWQFCFKIFHDSDGMRKVWQNEWVWIQPNDIAIKDCRIIYCFFLILSGWWYFPWSGIGS